MSSGVVLAAWYYGVLGAYFTHSVWFSLGVAALLWFAVLSTVNALLPAAAAIGVVVGLTIVWAFQLPPALDVEPWHVRQKLHPSSLDNDEKSVPTWVFNLSVARFVVGGILIFVGVALLHATVEGQFLSAAVLAAGILALIVGITLILLALFRWYRSGRLSDRITFWYALTLVIFVVPPLVYLLNIRPYQGLAFQLSLLIVYLLAVLGWTRYFNSLPVDAAVKLERDVRYSLAESRRQVARWTELWLPLALVYLVGWIDDEEAGDSASQVLLAIALVSILIEAVLFIWGYWRWQRPPYQERWVADEDALDNFVILPQNSPLLAPSRAPAAVQYAPVVQQNQTVTTHRAPGTLDMYKLRTF